MTTTLSPRIVSQSAFHELHSEGLSMETRTSKLKALTLGCGKTSRWVSVLLQEHSDGVQFPPVQRGNQILSFQICERRGKQRDAPISPANKEEQVR